MAVDIKQVRGESVQVGDAVRFMGRSYRITRIVPYRHRQPQWPEAWTAYADGDDGWCITLFRGTPIQVVDA